MRAASAFARARAAAILADDRLLRRDALLAADSDRAPSEWTSSVFSWVSISYVLTIKKGRCKAPSCYPVRAARLGCNVFLLFCPRLIRCCQTRQIANT